MEKEILAYVAGYNTGERDATGRVVFEGDEYSFSDPDDDGNLVIEEVVE